MHFAYCCEIKRKASTASPILATMRRFNRLATLSRAVSSGGATSAAAQHRHHQLAQPAALFSTFSSCQSQGFAQKIVNRLGPSFAGGVAGFSAAAPSLAQDAKPQAKEQPRSQKFSDVVLYQYEACPFCNKVKGLLVYFYHLSFLYYFILLRKKRVLDPKLLGK